MTNEEKIMVMRVVEIGNSLISDGYLVRCKLILPDGYYTKYKHRKNGNIITVIANYKNRKITLKRNGKISKEEHLT